MSWGIQVSLLSYVSAFFRSLQSHNALSTDGDPLFYPSRGLTLIFFVRSEPTRIGIISNKETKLKYSFGALMLVVRYFVGWLFGVYGMSTFVGYLTPIPFLYK